MENNSEQFPEVSNEESSIFDDDRAVPVFFSANAIYICAVLFGVLFGSIMFAMNINVTKERRGFWQIIGFGVLFTIMQIIVIGYFPGAGSASIFFNIAGAIIIRNFLWKEYLGAYPVYTKRSVLVPAIIGIALSALVILAVIYGGR